MDCIALILLAREETDTLPSRDFITRASGKNRQAVVSMTSFLAQEKV